MTMNRALLVVDVQNDFCNGGRLAVAGADSIVPTINNYIDLFFKHGMPVFASRDWHPADSKHFRKNGGKWPDHCIADTHGALFHPDLHLPDNTVVFSKGMNSGNDGYTVFEGVDPDGVQFEAFLKLKRIGELTVAGLATDYCVKTTVMDALSRGFPVRLCMDAVRGVDVEYGDSVKAINEMLIGGAIKTDFASVAAEV